MARRRRTEFGPYQSLELLGEGNVASVYKAYDPDSDQPVALKVFVPGPSYGPDFIAHLEEVGQNLSKLRHPTILPVIDFGEAYGSAYLVTPFVESSTLTNYLLGRWLPFHVVRSVIKQVADALDFSHLRGIVHGNLNANNVFVDHDGTCLIADYGIAAIFENTTRLLTRGQQIGTSAYMSPEQFSRLPIHARSDVYSLSVILYEMLTGRMPFETPMFVPAMYVHIYDPMPFPPSNPPLSDDLQRAIFRGLAMDPAGRYATAAELVQAVDNAVLDG